MTVRRESTIQRYIGLSSEDKPTIVPVGSTYYASDTGVLYVTPDDGTNWVEKDTVVRLETSPSIDIGDVTLLAGTALVGKVEIDQATANANEVVVKSITAGDTNIGNVDVLSIAAGTTRIGTVSGVLKEVRVTKALDASLGAYAANDVVSEEDCATTGASAWTFSAVARANGEYGYIVGATIISESENVTPRLTLFLFNAAPTGCNLLDNTANTAPDSEDLAKYVGKIDISALESLGTTDSVATVTPSTVGNLPLAFKCAAAADDLFGVLVTRDVFTQTPTDDLTIVLLVEQY